MIAYIDGIIRVAQSNYVVIMTNGIGYKVFVPDSLIFHEGQEVCLETSMIVREDSLTLYGFSTSNERDLFEMLITINGVGPKVALAILSTLSIDNLRNAVVSERADILTRVPGIGKKSAQKILLELKHKLPKGLDDLPTEVFDDINTDVIDTLVALGYSIVEAQTAVQALPPEAPNDIEERVRLALQYFAQ